MPVNWRVCKCGDRLFGVAPCLTCGTRVPRKYRCKCCKVPCDTLELFLGIAICSKCWIVLRRVRARLLKAVNVPKGKCPTCGRLAYLVEAFGMAFCKKCAAKHQEA